LAGLLLPLVAFCNGAASGGETPVAQSHINVGYSAQVFADVDVEAKGIAKVWSEQILKRKFGEGTSRDLIFTDVASFEAAFRRKEVDVAAIVADEYVALRTRVAMQPAFVTFDEGGVYQSVVLLVRRDGGVRVLLDLKGGRLSASIEHAHSVHLKWLEVLLMREGFRTAGDFFAKVGKAKGPSQAILSVFFKQADACLTTMQAFRLASELNPQIGRELVPLAQSLGGASGMIVFRPDLGEAEKKSLTAVLETMHLDPQGRQLLRLFRMSGLVPFKEEYLESVDALQKEHDRLARRLALGKPR
jgi:phosphonate transport system substrate-binding protein